MSSNKEGWNTLEVSLEDGGYEGQDLSEWGHAAPFYKKKLEGWMSKAQGERGSASKDQACSPSRLGCGVVMGSRDPAVRFISLAHV